MVGGGDPLYLKFWVSRPRWSKIADFEPIMARSASAVTPCIKVTFRFFYYEVNQQIELCGYSVC